MEREVAARARLAAEGLDASAWGNGPGDRYAQHEHPYDKVIVVVEGSIRFELDGGPRSEDLRAGDRLELPAGTMHAALVGADGVTCLEAHLTRGSLARGVRRVEGWLVSDQR